MANFYSDYLTKVRAGRRANPTEAYGKVRVLNFETASFNATINDTITLVLLRKGWQVLTGKVYFSAFGAGVTMDIGTYGVASDGISLGVVDDEDRFLVAAAVAAAGSASFPLISTGDMYKPTVDQFIAAKLEVAEPAAGTLNGFVLVVAD